MDPVARLRRSLGAAALGGCLLLALHGGAGAAPDDGVPVVYAADVDAIIHPVAAEYMDDVISRAEAAEASLVVFTLRTPGGLVDSTRSIVSRMIASRVPIAVFVGPAGARAASAGFVLVLAADLAVMAPGTHIGAATPVSGSGEKVDEAVTRKATSDMAAYVRTIASKRQRNVALAEEAVSEARAFTEEEARAASPPLVDLIATDVADLLRQADGRTIRRFDGTETVLHTANARIVQSAMNWRQRILSAIAHPNVAYILLSLGTLGLTIELWNPGAILPGVVGGICLLLAFFAFQVLPVNSAGLLLMLFGLGLLVLEVKVTSFGLLTAGGIASLVLGAMMLVDSTAPELQVSLRVILPVTIGLAGILFFLVQLAVQAQRRPSVTGDSGMLGQVGRALTVIEAGRAGQIATRGEIWQAESREPIAAGDPVRIVAVQGLTVTVERVQT